LLAGILFALLLYAESSFSDLGGLVFIAIGAAAIGLGQQPNGLAGSLLDTVDRGRQAVAGWRARPPTTVTVRPRSPIGAAVEAQGDA
jgi:hypothetical protein